jgi:hypothetical protein
MMNTVAVTFHVLLPTSGSLRLYPEAQLATMLTELSAAAASTDGLGGMLRLTVGDAPPLVLLDALGPAISNVCLRPVPEVIAGALVEGQAFNHGGGWRFTPLGADEVTIGAIGGIFDLGSLWPGAQSEFLIAPRAETAVALAGCARRYIRFVEASLELAATLRFELADLRAALAAAEAALAATTPLAHDID